MEFVVNEAGCKQLILSMLETMRKIATLVSDIEGENSTLKAALGDDYESIARSVRTMTGELTSAKSELNVIIDDMTEYIGRVHEARVALD